MTFEVIKGTIAAELVRLHRLRAQAPRLHHLAVPVVFTWIKDLMLHREVAEVLKVVPVQKNGHHHLVKKVNNSC